MQRIYANELLKYECYVMMGMFNCEKYDMNDNRDMVHVKINVIVI